MNILSQRSSRGFKVSGVLLLAYEDGGIYTKGGIKLDAFVQKDGGIKSDASRAIRSKEGYEKAYKDAYEDNYKSIRGLLSLPLLLKIAGRFFKPGRPLLQAE